MVNRLVRADVGPNSAPRDDTVGGHPADVRDNGELRVPTLKVTAELLLDGSQRLNGVLFLAKGAALHAGPTRPEERLNDATDFVPFEQNGRTSTLVLNKRAILAAWVDEAQSEVESSLPQRTVRVHAGAHTFTGTLALETPKTQFRVSDHLNAAGRFVGLWEGARLCLVNKLFIVSVEEVPT